jgi:DNA modification methylase
VSAARASVSRAAASSPAVSNLQGALALRLVETPPYYREELCLWNVNSEEETLHSLHSVNACPQGLRAEVPAYLIRKYSKRGSVVLDPFCGGGSTGLEANMVGRVAFLSDVNPLALAVAQARLSPADLAEVTLALQVLVLRRPVEMGPFGEVFKHFFDAETFREVVNLRSILSQREDRVASFIRFIALSLLHGPSAGYLSAATSNAVSVTPQEQAALNVQRAQVPEYRAVMPRILRKTASALRDGVPSVMRQVAIQNRVCAADARSLAYIPSGAVDLVVTQPPLPGPENMVREQWLKLWFLGVQSQPLSQQLWRGPSVDGWLNFMNETLIELARVVKGGGRAALALSDVVLMRKSEELDLHLIDMVQRDLQRFWYVECVITQPEPVPAVGAGTRGRRSEQVASNTKIVVLRRR